MITLTAIQLRKAADIKERIEKLQKELEEVLQGGTSVKLVAIPKDGRRKKAHHSQSPKFRREQAARMKKHWAKQRRRNKAAKPASAGGTPIV